MTHAHPSSHYRRFGGFGSHEQVPAALSMEPGSCVPSRRRGAVSRVKIKKAHTIVREVTLQNQEGLGSVAV